jgi:chorismate synthase
MDIWFNTAFKPVATLLQTQSTADTSGTPIELKGKGRHDPCVLPRAVPIVDAMTALVIVDFMMYRAASKIVS